MTQKIEFDSEYILHKLTEANLKKLFDLEFVASEIKTNSLRLDNLAFDEKTKTFVIIEYKNELNLNAVNQVLEYCQLLEDNPEFFAERLENRNDIDFENTRAMIISPEFSRKQIEDSPDNLEIWKISMYDDGRVIYENMKTGENKILEVNPEDLKLSEQKVLNGKDEKLCKLYLNFKNNVLNNFDDIKLRYLVGAVSFRVNNQIACIFRLENPAKIHFHSDDINDPQNRTRDISDISTGAKANYELIINSPEDTDYAFDLFKEVYLQKRSV